MSTNNDYVVLPKSDWEAIMNAIRSKNGSSDLILSGDAAAKISAITTGITPSGTKSITSNGTHDVTKYASADVNVPIPTGYVKPSGAYSITSNGTYTVTNYASASVNVPIGVFPSHTIDEYASITLSSGETKVFLAGTYLSSGYIITAEKAPSSGMYISDQTYPVSQTAIQITTDGSFSVDDIKHVVIVVYRPKDGDYICHLWYNVSQQSGYVATVDPVDGGSSRRAVASDEWSMSDISSTVIEFAYVYKSSYVFNTDAYYYAHIYYETQEKFDGEILG